MALSLVAKRRKRIQLLSPDLARFTAVSMRVLTELGWRIAAVDQDCIVAYTKVSLRSAGEEVRLQFQKDHVLITSECVGIQPTAFGKNNRNICRFTNRFNELWVSTSNEEVESILIELQDNEEISKELNSVATHSKNQISDIISIFFAKKDFYFTSKILSINIFLYILLWATGSYDPAYIMDTFYHFGGVHRGLINDGEWWRLLTQCFIHGGFLHLFFNMYTFLYVSLLLEPLIGRFTYLSLYLLSGIMASLSSVYYFDNIIAIGASGAIFGLFGATLALVIAGMLKNRIRISLILSLSVFLAYNLIFGVQEGIDYAAHTGGFISGFVFGLLIAWHIKTKHIWQQASAITLGTAFTALFVLFVFQHIEKKPSVFTYPHPLAVQMQLETFDFDKEGDVEKRLRFEQNRRLFAQQYNKARRAGKMFMTDNKELITRFEVGLRLMKKNMKILRIMKQDIQTYDDYTFVRDAAHSTDASLNLFRVYLHALKNPNHSYGKFIRPYFNQSLTLHRQLSISSHLIDSDNRYFPNQ